jgi:dipeptide/tripeptide permease
VDRFPQRTIDDIKAVYRVGSSSPPTHLRQVGTLFLFYPMFWALYDQQGSRWTIQVASHSALASSPTFLTQLKPRR